MKKTVKKLAAIALAAAFTCGALGALTGCQPGQGPIDPDVINAYDHEATSQHYYEDVLGDFYVSYTKAKGESDDLSLRYALMAQAEAKLYESGVLLPTQARGGNYAVSKVFNRTVNSTAWGNDSDRLHYSLVATTPIKAEDRIAMRDYSNAHLDISGADYIQWLKETYIDSGKYTQKDSYTTTYTGDPKTWDVLSTSQQADSEPVVQTYDGLIEYDVMNHMQPALAEAIPEPVAAGKADAADGAGFEGADVVTYTFKIRSGLKWVNSKEAEVADVKADDFVAGFQHMLDTKGGLEYLVEGAVVGASGYINGTAKDISKVAVKADDAANTVTYTVYKSAQSYFLTMLAYNVFAPMSRQFYTSKGGEFGTEFDPTAETYSYGKTFEDIAFCGPFIISEHTANSKIAYKANAKWWNKDGKNALNISTLTYLYNDGKDVTKNYKDFKANTIDGCGLTSSNLTSSKTDKYGSDADTIFDTYAYTSSMDSTAFCSFANVNRQAYANYNDGAGASTKTDAQKALSKAALGNVHFRRALNASIDRVTYMTQVLGGELAENAISNMYTPGTFVQLSDETTIKMNGADVTYPAGTYYGEIVQDQLDADGVEITVWKEVGGEYKYTGFDGWHNEEYAKSEFELALETLSIYGDVSAENPIYIDYPYNDSDNDYKARAGALKQNIESVFSNRVKLNLVGVDQTAWYYAGYYTSDGSQANYDIYDLSGWGPDYGDPQTYLDTMLPNYGGYMTKCLGLF